MIIAIQRKFDILMEKATNLERNVTERKVKISKLKNESNKKKRARDNDMKDMKKGHNDGEKKNHTARKLKEYDDSDLDIIEILSDEEDIQIIYDRKKCL
jgi:hypothetical protein